MSNLFLTSLNSYHLPLTSLFYNAFVKFFLQKFALVVVAGVLTLGAAGWLAVWPWARAKSQFTVVLADVSDGTVAKIISDINSRLPEVESIHYVSKVEGLQAMAQAPGFDKWGMWMMDNPVPPILMVRVSPWLMWGDGVEDAFQVLRTRPSVELVIADVPAIRAWFALVGRLGVLVWILAAAAWCGVWLGWRRIADQQVHTLTWSVHEVKASGGTLAAAVALSRRHQRYQAIACLLVLALAYGYAAGAVTLVAQATGISVGSWTGVVWGMVALAVWQISEIVWGRAVTRVWQQLP